MKSSNKEITINHNAKQLFNIVLDLEKYPEFIPWCLDMRIHSKKANEIFADMYVLYKIVLPQKFGSHVIFNIKKLNIKRSEIPAVTHVDYSARIQTLTKKDNKRIYKLLKKFDEITKCPVLVNTSFNVKDEPIVCSPLDAYKCFINTGLDVLVLGNYIIDDKKVKLN